MAKRKKIRVEITEGLYEMVRELSQQKGWSFKDTASLVFTFGMLNLLSVKRYTPSQRCTLLLQADGAEGIGGLLRVSANIDPELQAEFQRQLNEVMEFLTPTWDAGVEP